MRPAMTPRARFILASASTANLAANLLFPVLAVRALGIGTDVDALFMVFILPGLVMVLLGNSVLNWSTPRLVRRVDDASRRALCWSLLWILLALVGGGCAVLGLAGAWWLPRLDPAGSYAQAVAVLPAGLVAMLATVVVAIAQSLHVAERDVAGSEWRTLLANLATALLWFALSPATLWACALLFALRPLLTAMMLAPRLGPPRRPDTSDEDLRAVLRESRWLMLAATYYKSEPFVDRLLFATVSGGAVAAFHIAQQVMGTVSLLVNRTVTAPMVAPLAASVHAGETAKAASLLRRTLWRVGWIGMAVWAVLLVAADPFVALLFSGMDAQAASVALTAQMLQVLGGYLLAMLLGQVLAQAYYCSGATRRMIALGIAGYTTGLVVKVVLLWRFGVMGLVVASSLAWLFNAMLMRLFLPAGVRRSREQPA